MLGAFTAALSFAIPPFAQQSILITSGHRVPSNAPGKATIYFRSTEGRFAESGNYYIEGPQVIKIYYLRE
jgi:hypothetical protein